MKSLGSSITLSLTVQNTTITARPLEWNLSKIVYNSSLFHTISVKSAVTLSTKLRIKWFQRQFKDSSCHYLSNKNHNFWFANNCQFILEVHPIFWSAYNLDTFFPLNLKSLFTSFITSMASIQRIHSQYLLYCKTQ